MKNKGIITMVKKKEDKQKVHTDQVTGKKYVIYQKDGKEERVFIDDPKKSRMSDTELEHIHSFVEAERKTSGRFIFDERKLPQRLHHAVGTVKIGKEHLRYYGAYMHEMQKKTLNQKGGSTKTTLVKVESPVIILENRSIISIANNTYDDLDFEFSSIMSVKNRWSRKSISEWVALEKKFETTFSDVYEAFKHFYDTSMIYEDPIWYKFSALWDMCTYYQDLLDKSLIVKIEGVSGAGKSKTGKICRNLAFNGVKFVQPSVSSFFRYRHNNKATIILEEAERLFNDNKNQNGDDELVEYLNASYEKGNTVPRQNDKNINQTDEFDPYGWTKIGAINPLKGALAKRSVTQFQIKGKINDPRTEVEVPSSQDPGYCAARDLAYINGLMNYRKYQDKLRTLKNKWKLANREWAISKPILAMADLVNSELVDEIGDFLEGRFNVRNDSLDHDSWNYKLAMVLITHTATEQDSFMYVSEIKDKFVLELKNEYSNFSEKKIASLMRGLGLSDFSARKNDGRGYNLSFYKTIEILMRNETINLESILVRLSSLALTSKYSVKDVEKWYNEIFGNKEKVSAQKKVVRNHEEYLVKYFEKFDPQNKGLKVETIKTCCLLEDSHIEQFKTKGIVCEHEVGILRMVNN